MYYLVGIFALLMIGLRFCYERDYDMFSIVIIVIALILLLPIIIWPLQYMDNVTTVQKFYSVQQALESSRSDPSTDAIERAAVIMSVAEKNEWLAAMKYQRNWPVVRDMIPAVVDTMHAIK